MNILTKVINTHIYGLTYSNEYLQPWYGYHWNVNIACQIWSAKVKQGRFSYSFREIHIVQRWPIFMKIEAKQNIGTPPFIKFLKSQTTCTKHKRVMSI